MKKVLLVIGIILLFAQPAFAQNAAPQDKTFIIKAKVLEVVKDVVQILPGTTVQEEDQTLNIQILDGQDKDKVVTIENNYAKLKKGSVFYLKEDMSSADGSISYTAQDPYRLPVIYFFAALFVVLVVLVGGVQGIRGLLSLIGSFLLVLYVLLPGILHGFSPILVSIVVSSFIIILGSYITHGFNKTTSSAVIGMIITVIFTGLLAFLAVHMANFTGNSSEEAVALNINNNGHIDIIGILLGGIMIGLLGVLYDVAIGQAISVEELHHIAPHISRRSIYIRALRIGREHIGALVNTLAIAYVGVSLPLLLLLSQSHDPIGFTVNREIFSTEIIRTLIGSIGLVMAVPITTLLAVLLLVKVQKAKDEAVIKDESEALKHFHHHH